MYKVATLGPSVRLIVFQYHVKNVNVPDNIPKYSDFHKSTAGQFDGTGVRVMEPTTDVLSEFIADSGYQLIDTWHNTEEDDWTRSVVRFVFCHKEHLNPAGLRPEFVAGRNDFLNSLKQLTDKNLWQTMAHVNPFFITGKATSETVLILDCNSRKATTKLTQVNKDRAEEIPTWEEVPVTVFQGGREKVEQGIGPGIGPKIPLTDKANRLKLIGNEVVLVTPK